MKAIIRKDLRMNGAFPASNKDLSRERISQVFDSIQPEAWDSREFNTILYSPESQVFYLVNSIDFEFINKEEKQP